MTDETARILAQYGTATQRCEYALRHAAGAYRAAVDAAGYASLIEMEIFNQKIWDQPGDQGLDFMNRRFQESV